MSDTSSSNELLAEIKRRDVLFDEMEPATIANYHTWIGGWAGTAAKDRRALLIEIERLQRELNGANNTIAHFMGPEGEKYIDRFAAMLSGPVSLEESIRRYSAPEPCADEQFMDFLQRWVDNSKSRGFKWDSFTFDTSRPVREQLYEQMKAGMTELPKGSAQTKGADQP